MTENIAIRQKTDRGKTKFPSKKITVMTSQKLVNILSIISSNLEQEKISFALIGALALSFYGLPRYTSDIDILAEERFSSVIQSIMEKLGYTCYQKSAAFAQFDSELGVYGNIDFMFVKTQDGKDILKRSAVVKDDLFGMHRIIQPTDYIILKLMAIANNPDRAYQDEADIITFLKSYEQNLIPDYFEPLDIDRIKKFSGRFGQTERVKKYFQDVSTLKFK